MPAFAQCRHGTAADAEDAVGERAVGYGPGEGEAAYAYRHQENGVLIALIRIRTLDRRIADGLDRLAQFLYISAAKGVWRAGCIGAERRESATVCPLVPVSRAQITPGQSRQPRRPRPVPDRADPLGATLRERMAECRFG